MLLMAVMAALGGTGCRQQSNEVNQSEGFEMRDAADCLPEILNRKVRLEVSP